MNKFFSCTFLIVASFLPFSSSSQSNEAQMPNATVAEKVYLQLSSKVFGLGQTMWFKAVVTDAENHLPSKLSAVLYVELINSEEQIIERKLVKLNDGIGHGSFDLQRNYIPGSYQLRAYTQWNRNFGNDFIFTTYLSLYEASKEHNLKLGFNGKSTQTAATKGVVKTEITPKVTFFPESGRLVDGFQNKIGFKTLDVNGLGIVAEGEVYDNKGQRVASFKSNHLGMGFFYLKPNSAAAYRARIFFPNNKRPTINVALPKVERKGSIISVFKTKDKARLRVHSNTLDGKVFIQASSRGVEYFLIEGHLKQGTLQTELAADRLPEGIVAFTLLDDTKTPHAERLYFNEREVNQLQISLKTDAKEYYQREETQLIVGVKSDGDASGSDVSVLVLNREERHQGRRGTIRSYFLLSSELRGEIEQPGYYFKKDNPLRFRDLEALMLTQGWRKYKFPIRKIQNTQFWPQTVLNLRGRVHDKTPKRKPVPELDLTLGVFGKQPTYYNQQTDSLGRFNFLLEDTYGKARRLILQGNERGVKRKDITISLQKESVPQPNYVQRPFIEVLDGPVLAVVQAQQRRNIAQAAFDSLSGVTQLDEVVLEGFKLTPSRERAYKNFGSPDVIIQGDTLRKKEKNWSYGLYSILLFNYPDQVQIERFSDGFMLANVNNGHTLVAVDGRLIRDYEYEAVQDLSPEIVESVEIMQFVPFFKNKYLQVFPETSFLDAPTIGHVIAIFTKNRIGLNNSGKPIPGVLSTTIEGFSPIKEFYAPKYNVTVKPNSNKPDLRSLIHWVPSISTDKDGKASASFYNGDIAGDYLIIVEAIAEDGRIGYEELDYRVREKTQ